MTIRTMLPAAATILLTVCGAVGALASGLELTEKFRLLRERAGQDERNVLLQAARSPAKGTQRTAVQEADSGESSLDSHESRIIELPSLPTPDVAYLRRTLGLDQAAASNRDAPKALAAIRAADETPAPGDLAESDVVRLTPEIRNLARQRRLSFAQRPRRARLPHG